MKRKERESSSSSGIVSRRVVRNVFGNMVVVDKLQAERVSDPPMVLMSMGGEKDRSKKRRTKDAKEERKMNWNRIPTTEELQTRGVYDRVDAIARDMDKWSLFGLRKWRKPMKEDHVKRQQRKLKRMFLRNSSGDAESSSSTRSPSKSVPTRSPRKSVPTRIRSHDDDEMEI